MTERRGGRPRDPAVDDAILTATIELLGEVGYTATSMEEVRRRAGVGKDTLYRRWPAKEALVRDAIARLAAREITVPHTADPAADLRAYLTEIVRILTVGDFGRIIAGLVGEAARSPQLAVTFHAFWAERRNAARTVVRRWLEATRPGDLDAADLFVDLLAGALYYRHLLSGAPLTGKVVDDLVGLLEGSPPA
jgi:AcrR family transcriptional regulator